MKKKYLKLDEMREIARVATRKALEGKEIPLEMKNEIVLGCRFDGDLRIFELYIPGPRPQDAKVISQATVDRRTGDIVTEIFF